MRLEAALEPIFHPDSYGYRPGRSAHDALAVCRRRCWEKDWVLDCDIRAFFDSVPHHLLMKAVAHHTSERWVLLYIERWLKAPMQMSDGTLTPRERGTPQGSPISPVLANLFMHYAFDRWMDREHPDCPFERYADLSRTRDKSAYAEDRIMPSFMRSPSVCAGFVSGCSA
jgi:group II intron reverse transcriptase/maturase